MPKIEHHDIQSCFCNMWWPNLTDGSESKSKFVCMNRIHSPVKYVYAAIDNSNKSKCDIYLDLLLYWCLIMIIILYIYKCLSF